MRMFYSPVLTLAVIFHSVESSSQSDDIPNSQRNPSNAPSGRQHTPNRTSAREPPSRTRFKFPGNWPPPSKVLGYTLEELGHVRLIPHTNQSLTFEFRNFIFPADIPIRWRADGNRISSVQPEEHIVLSTSDGDIFAILANSGSLRGILKAEREYPRVKMNMISGAVDYLTPDEVRDCPVGRNNPIFPHNFVKALSNHDSLRFKWNSDGERAPAHSILSTTQHPPDQSSTSEESLVRERSESPPIRSPSDQVLGYTMDQLGYVRLIPPTNQNQQLEFRRYVFPTKKPIRMIKGLYTGVFSPNREYIVLSTSNGDVLAILDQSGILCGIYRTLRTHSRVKINMISGAVDDMIQDEKRDCPLGKSHPIFPKTFIRGCSNSNSLQFVWNAHGVQTPYIFSPVTQHAPERTSCQEPPPDDRSRSPPGRPPSDEVLGYTLAKLGYIRFIPRMNPNRQFEFRRYVFPASAGIHLMSGASKFLPVPTREHIVLSTSDGDVFAILEYTGTLRGIYKSNREYKSRYSRVRINMINGEVNYMTEFEINECHVGKNYPIFPRWFDKVVSNEDSLQYRYQ